MRAARFENRLFAVQCAAGLVSGHARPDNVALLFRLDHRAHRRARIFFSREQRAGSEPLRAAVRDEAQASVEHGRVGAGTLRAMMPPACAYSRSADCRFNA
ncbi:hypothetical protein [Massilia pseudoviolaceinigra]|uniref:hypothetical protein n=1 Tax=Massilia pseudoviolaceinigra TaxID=3057165 RepID=UPI0027966E98|nr:hypothetical protein [Massilia sp. CCM 9206]MDQ1919830.1 hypothetical protein [Massilia sp. CCM 9206]